jgi:hypothetical protein
MRWALRSAIDKFEREWNYDASYIRDVMIDASPRAAWLFLRVTGLLAAAALVGGLGLPHRRPHMSRTSRPPSVFTP